MRSTGLAEVAMRVQELSVECHAPATLADEEEVDTEVGDACLRGWKRKRS